MPPILALFLTVVFVGVLFLRDRHDFPRRSIALWLPLTYFFILATKLPSMWIGYGSDVGSVEALQEGNSLDRVVYFGLLLASLFVLSTRRVSLWSVLRSNLFLCLLVVYSLISVAWSDFPFIALKRWVRDFGVYATIAVAVSDNDVQSIRLLFRRLAYLVLPLSILLIKYYPKLGRGFDGWTGQAVNFGATWGKNGLGAVCMLCGLYLLWDCLAMWRSSQWSRRIFVVNLVLAAMVVWLMTMADSATSTVCLVVGSVYLTVMYVQPAFLKPKTINRVFVGGLIVMALTNQVFDLGAVVAKTMSRSVSFTDRTTLWAAILKTADAPLLGVGYESFWLGDRLEKLWSQFSFLPNQAHNGYLDFYINLGGIGLAILMGMFVVYYRRMSRSLSTNGYACNALAIGVLAISLFYNVTEAAFKAHILWYAFLVLAMSTEMRSERDERAVSQKNPLLAAYPQTRLRESAARNTTRPVPAAPGRRPLGQARSRSQRVP